MPIFEETKKAPKKAKTQFDLLATKVREADACRMVSERIGAYRMSMVRMMKETGE